MIRKKVCTIGGGTGNFAVLQGLKEYDIDLCAIVTMSDDGGSTGILRDELGVLPAGDTRQCLVALSNASEMMRNLMNYRFERGVFRGHSFGNLFLSALEKVSGNFERAIDELGRILNMRGKVIPVTTDHVRLQMLLKDKTLLDGEKKIYLSDRIIDGYEKIWLTPNPTVNPKVLEAIKEADIIVLGPGGLYTSLISNLLVDQVAKAIENARATKVFVVNLMNRVGQTDNFCVSDYLEEINQFFSHDPFDFIIVNNKKISSVLLERYKDQGEIVRNDLVDERVILAPLLGSVLPQNPHDLMQRNLIRHDSRKLSKAIMGACKIRSVNALCF